MKDKIRYSDKAPGEGAISSILNVHILIFIISADKYMFGKYQSHSLYQTLMQ